MKLIVAGTYQQAREVAREHGLTEGRGVRFVTPASARYLRGLTKKPGDELIVGHFDVSMSEAELRRREELWENLRMGGWK